MFHVKHSAIAFMIMAEKRFLNRERFFSQTANYWE